MRRLISLAVVLFAVPLFALDPKSVRAEYERLQKWRFSQPATLSAPVTLTRDTATWTLTAGTVRLMEPASDGLVSGFVFEGHSSARMKSRTRGGVTRSAGRRIAISG